MNLQGVVEVGRGWARHYGYPTANLRLQALPGAPGTWAARATINDTPYQAAAYCSAHQGHPLCEVHLLDYTGDLYGQTLHVELLSHVADPIPFRGEAEMQEKIHQDMTAVRAYFAQHIH